MSRFIVRIEYEVPDDGECAHWKHNLKALADHVIEDGMAGYIDEAQDSRIISVEVTHDTTRRAIAQDGTRQAN